MQLNERFKKFPIKFYKDLKSNKIVYESGFTNGTADTLNNAFKLFDTYEFTRDLYYYFDDIIDVRVGRYIPALKDVVRDNKLYLGKLEVELDIDKTDISDIDKSVTYLSKDKEKLNKHLQWIDRMKKQERRSELKDKIKSTVNNIILALKGQKAVTEMFEPLKAANELTCAHCGKPIQIGTYYERYRKANYHLECIWDKLTNDMEQNSYEEAEKYFWSLQSYIGNWPAYGKDVEEDYVSDLELVKSNNRRLNHFPNIRSIKEALDWYSNNESI